MVKDRLWTGSFFAACGANFLMFFAFYMLLPILPMYLAEQFAVTKSTAGLILSSYTIMALLFRPFAGFMVDSFPRKPLLLICYTFFISYFGGYMLAGALAVFAVLRATHGMAFGMVTVSVNTVAIDIMPASRRGEGIGYFGVSTNLAMAIGPMVALMIHDATPDYDWIFATALGVGLLGLFVASLVKGTKTEAVGAKQTISLDRFLLLKGVPGAVTTIFLSFAYGVLSTYVAVYGKEEVGLAGGTGLFFVCLSGGLVVSRLISGQLINRGYLTQVSKAGISLLIAGFLCFVFIKHPLSFYGCGVAIGVGYGLLCPTLQTMFINLAHHNQRGTANATYLTSWDFGVGSGVLLGGIIAQHTSYSSAFLLGTVLLCVGLTLFFVWSGPYFDRNKLR
ncbi:MFS transporter [Rikenella microfusus]|uniref:MFS transporter n=1 Tax=Rikenella microfusus TaxID=28139 RepID=UPI001D7FA436|nr:MFS transporter [Rikenella microfusus]HJE88441.1 MFS transporter [Rikenella microfusus]